jgi:hypothetical protein
MIWVSLYNKYKKKRCQIMGIEYGQVNNYAKYGRPTLDLQFSGPKGSIRNRADGGATGVEFTRTTTATYVGSDGLIKTAAVDEARFDHDPVTGESLGLLIEEERTNLFTQSQTFSTWTHINGVEFTLTPNAGTAPDNTNTATKLTETATTSVHRVAFGINLTGTYTMTVFAKAAERNILTVSPASTGGGASPVYFDLANGTISASLGSAQSAAIQELPNGWYRCTVTDGMASFGSPFVGVAAVSGTESYTGDGTSGIYIWGAQLEAGSFATSYIPTSGSTSSRASDVAEIKGNNWLNTWSTSGSGNSIYAEGSINYTTDAPYPGGPLLYTMDGFSSGLTKVWYSYLEAVRGPIDGVGSGGGAVDLFHGAVTSRGPGTFKSCMTFDVPNNRLQSAWNTVLSSSASSAASFNDMWTAGSNPRLTIGGKYIGDDRRAWCGCIRRITVYNAGLTNAQLLAFTT